MPAYMPAFTNMSLRPLWGAHLLALREEILSRHCRHVLVY